MGVMSAKKEAPGCRAGLKKHRVARGFSFLHYAWRLSGRIELPKTLNLDEAV